MKRLLIVSPFFAPTDTVDQHRVRMNAPHYLEQGWLPTLLCVTPATAGRLCDPRLVETMPADLDVVRVNAWPERLCRLLGITAIGLRAFRALRRAGDRLLKNGDFDLVFFSTTAFPVMALGRRWKEKFEVPFVLDFQDPWATVNEEAKGYFRNGLKHGLMRRLHRLLERHAVPRSDGLMAVSKNYIDELRDTYPEIAAIPSEVIPFGYSNADVKTSAAKGNSLLGSAVRPVGVYAGTVGPSMHRSLHALFEFLAPAGQTAPSTLFVGSHYDHRVTHEVVRPISAEYGLEKRTQEIPGRVPMLDAHATLSAADFLILLGSDDAAYQPSKLYHYLSLGKPVLCAAPAGSKLHELLAGLSLVICLHNNESNLEEKRRQFADLLSNSTTTGLAAQRALAEKFEATTLAARECALFDRVYAKCMK